MGSLVAGEGRNPHFAHDFEQAVLHSFPICIDNRVLTPVPFEVPIAVRFLNRSERHVRVDRIRSIAGQQAEVVNFASFARLQNDPDSSPKFVLDEVMVNRSAGQQRTDWNPSIAHRAIRQDDQTVTIIDRLLGFCTDSLKGFAMTLRTIFAGEGNVDDLGRPASIVQAFESSHLTVAQNRVRNHHPVTLLRSRRQKVPFRTDVATQTHDDVFADRVDRRVGHLGEELLEVVIEHPRLVTQTGQSCIVSHAADRVFLGIQHRVEHEVHRLDGVPERLHLMDQIVIVSGVVDELSSGEFLDVNRLLIEPLAIRTLLSNRFLDLFIADDPSLFEVNQEHLAGLETTLRFDIGGFDIKHTNFARHDDLVIMRQVVARRTQAVSVENRTDHAAISK